MPNVREQPLRVAMVGCGCVAKYGHAPAIAASGSLTCVAYVDKDRSRAEDFARCFGGGDVYEDYRRVLDRKDVDAVAVLTMPTAHGPIVLDALRAGKHVFEEWEHFARMVREDLDPYPALHDALASLRIVTSGHRSAVEGVLIDLRTDSRDINP